MKYIENNILWKYCRPITVHVLRFFLFFFLKFDKNDKIDYANETDFFPLKFKYNKSQIMSR